MTALLANLRPAAVLKVCQGRAGGHGVSNVSIGRRRVIGGNVIRGNGTAVFVMGFFKNDRSSGVRQFDETAAGNSRLVVIVIVFHVLKQVRC
jgi:hypothetical protein